MAKSTTIHQLLLTTIIFSLIKVSCGQGTFHVGEIEYKENGKDTTDKCIKLCVITPSTGYHRCNPNITTFTTKTRIRKGNMKGYPDPYEHDFKYVDWEDNSELSVTVWKLLKGQSCDTPGPTNSTYYGEATAIIPRLEMQKEYSIVSDNWELDIRTYLKCNKTGCLLACVPQDNTAGHYKCVDGNKQCLKNWFRVQDNCTTFCDRNATNYKCDDEGQRTCGTNWFNKNCEQYCNSSEGNYLCDNEGNRVCFLHWYGQNCTKYCNNSATNYKCNDQGDKTCLRDWYGPNCLKYCNSKDEKFKCNKDGDKICLRNWYGKNCNKFCNNSKAITGSVIKYRCNEKGEKVCTESDRYGPECDMQYTAIGLSDTPNTGRSVGDNSLYYCKVVEGMNTSMNCPKGWTDTNCLSSCKNIHKDLEEYKDKCEKSKGREKLCSNNTMATAECVWEPVPSPGIAHELKDPGQSVPDVSLYGGLFGTLFLILIITTIIVVYVSVKKKQQTTTSPAYETPVELTREFNRAELTLNIDELIRRRQSNTDELGYDNPGLMVENPLYENTRNLRAAIPFKQKSFAISADDVFTMNHATV